MLFSKNILAVEPSLTLALNAKAIELEKQGVDLVKLTAGEPDFPTPEPICEAAFKAIKEGKTKYTDAKGILDLRKKISEYLNKRLNIKYDPNDIVVTNGGKQAIYNILLAMINPGDEVMIFDPSWVSYDAQIKMVGGLPVHVPLDEEEGFLPTESKIRRYLSPKTKVIMINTPNNPTGVVYPKSTLEMIAKISKENEILVLSDEVYELLVYDGQFTSIATIDDMKERTAIVNAFSKTWSMTGWRVGYCTGPQKLMKEVSKIQSHATSNINTPSQYAAMAAFDYDVMPMYQEFKNRRDYISSRLSKMGLKFVKPAGAFYVFINVEEFGMEDSVFAQKLLEDAKIAVVPGSGFYKKGYVRISFATSMKMLEKAADRLEKFVGELRK
ncbi:MAG TPA: aspartate aminotransferase [Petrotogaceae bacterium]|jgi:aspartate aminotransferase|nr:aspartate aminotransferase [Petrotogaceae bacterium]HQF33220.1 aspartate aminotransferase [Petrotogaceae bacterium]HQH32180.1 aspartate aminotransferase [Petrotogaceae bacterium]HQI78515.1 aspartate aminotransferase [Petrotogaceae bacterium]